MTPAMTLVAPGPAPSGQLQTAHRATGEDDGFGAVLRDRGRTGNGEGGNAPPQGTRDAAGDGATSTDEGTTGAQAAAPDDLQNQALASPDRSRHRLAGLDFARRFGLGAAGTPAGETDEDAEAPPGDTADAEDAEATAPETAGVALQIAASAGDPRTRAGQVRTAQQAQQAHDGTRNPPPDSADGDAAIGGTGAVDAAEAEPGADENSADTRRNPRAALARDQSVAAPARITVVSEQNYVAPAQPAITSVGTSVVEAVASEAESQHAARDISGADGVSQGDRTGPAREIRIQLNPAELGSVTARLRLAGDILMVEVQVEQLDTWRRVAAEKDAIVSSLRGLGFAIDDVSIVHTSQGANGAGNQADGNRQQGSRASDPGAGGTGRDGSAERNGGGNDGRQGGEPSQRNGGGGAGAAGGGVYI